MNPSVFEFQGTLRNELGKGASRRMRRQEKVPGVVYGGGKEPLAIELSHNAVQQALKNEGVYSHLLALTVNGEKERVILKDLQRHPFKPRILHMDFLRVSATEKLHIHVPLHFLNEDKAPGVKTEGGMVNHHMIDVEISCLPDHLPEFIAVDLSGLHINHAIHLSELKLPEGVSIVALGHGEEHDHDHDAPVVSIHAVYEAPEEETAAPAPSEVPALQVKPDDKSSQEEPKK